MFLQSMKFISGVVYISLRVGTLFESFHSWFFYVYIIFELLSVFFLNQNLICLLPNFQEKWIRKIATFYTWKVKYYWLTTAYRSFRWHQCQDYIPAIPCQIKGNYLLFFDRNVWLVVDTTYPSLHCFSPFFINVRCKSKTMNAKWNRIWCEIAIIKDYHW